ncbi:hypothetical protein ABBQ38_004946 [Trebouxia sp. C0009 RCD-2024]
MLVSRCPCVTAGAPASSISGMRSTRSSPLRCLMRPANGRRVWSVLNIRCNAALTTAEPAAIMRNLATDPDRPKGKRWENVDKWVMFSDLHVSVKTLGVCISVLRTIKKEAVARKAGIVFLGDFWHVRGALPVEPLNAVLREIETWRQPTLMLVGNHDQVSVGGLDHALHPLAAACSAIHILEEPTLYRDALWLPYRKDKHQLKKAIAAAGPVKAIFAHADVMGAMMNEAFQAKEGLPPDLFPGSVPTYTGHYHKPHVVENTNIRYIGSPYQVSRSEAGQQKHLLVLDSNWQELERIPLDLGPRHFALTSASPALPADLRPGDKVKWTLPDPDAMKGAQKMTQDLLDRGIEVEVVTPAPQAAPRIPASQDLGALALFHSYAATVGMSQPALPAALELLREYEGQGAELKHQAAVIQFDQLQLEGYGPFREACTYDLTQRGFCVVTGRNEDDQGSESNGAGKSALVMAPLWALTGKSDARSGAGRGLTSSEVMNDEATLTRVSLRGHVNTVPFVIERSIKSGKRKTGAKKTALKFEYDGEDLTYLEQKLTQAEIDRVLGSDLLVRAVFHGQADVTGLLEAGDDKFKAELGWVVNLEMWDAAKQLAAQKLKGFSSELASVTSQEQLRLTDLTRLDTQAAEAQQRVAAWQQHLQQQQADVQAALSIVQDHVRSSIQVCRLKLAQLQHWLTHPAAPRQQEALSRQLQEAERQLVQFRQGAHDCELEVQRVTQQQLSGEPMLDEATQASGSATAGTASPVSPSPNSNPGFDARNSDRQGSGNGTSPSRRSDAGWSDESVGAVSDHDQGTFRATGQGPASPALGAWASRGGSLWEGAGVASSSTATVTPSAPAATRLPPRAPEHVVTADMQAAAEQVEHLQQQLMHHQAELGAKRADAQATRSSYQQYMSLAVHHNLHLNSPPDSAGLLCDRCLQPVDEDTFQANASRLQAAMEAAQALQVKAQQDVNSCTAAVEGAGRKLQRARLEAAESAEAAWRRQLAEHEAAVRQEQEAYQAQQAAREAALRHELEAWQAQEADRAAAEAEERERQAAQAAMRAAELQKADAIREAARQKERAAWAALRAAEARCAALQMESAQLRQSREAAQQLARGTWQGVEPVLARLADQQQVHEPVDDALHSATSDAAIPDEEVPQVCHECSSLLREAESASHDCTLQQQQLAALRRAVNPYAAESSRLSQIQAENQKALKDMGVQKTELQQKVGVWGEVDRGLSRTGVQSYALEGTLGELQELTSRYLEQLSSGTTLTLAAFRPATKSGAAEIERITKSVHVQSEGGLKERSIRQLSGGERRRVALALALGFADLVSGRGQLRCNLIVLDEVLQQLDGEGKARVGAVLRNLPQSTVLVVGQADSYLTDVSDNVDVVVKRNGCATLECAD